MNKIIALIMVALTILLVACKGPTLAVQETNDERFQGSALLAYPPDSEMLANDLSSTRFALVGDEYICTNSNTEAEIVFLEAYDNSESGLDGDWYTKVAIICDDEYLLEISASAIGFTYYGPYTIN